MQIIRKKVEMKNILRAIIVVSLLFITNNFLKAEIVYTKDGQVIKGNIIRENRRYVYIKTKYQVKRIKRRLIKRILFGDREMERVFIVMNDGTTIRGYLIDQNSKKIYLRKDKNSAKETVILKRKVRQMSRDVLIPLEPDFSIRAGIFVPFMPTGSKLKLAPIFRGVFSFNLPWFNRTRLGIESGYVKSYSDSNKDQGLWPGST